MKSFIKSRLRIALLIYKTKQKLYGKTVSWSRKVVIFFISVCLAATKIRTDLNFSSRIAICAFKPCTTVLPVTGRCVNWWVPASQKVVSKTWRVQFNPTQKQIWVHTTEQKWRCLMASTNRTAIVKVVLERGSPTGCCTIYKERSTAVWCSTAWGFMYHF